MRAWRTDIATLTNPEGNQRGNPEGWNRIKRLRGLSRPQYRLRIGEIRVFYDVKETTVEILAIVSKTEAQKWLEKQGAPVPGSRVSKG